MAQSETTAECNQDDMIMVQQRNIEREIAEATPLVGPLENVASLLGEYINDNVYRKKVETLGEKFTNVRRTRPDGNCFFRAFAHSYFESLVGDQVEFERFYKLAEQSKDKLVELGFMKFTLEDFHETFMSVLGLIRDGNSLESVLSVMTDQGQSDYVVVYLRLLTSAQLQCQADFFINFLDGFSSVKEFCRLEVEPMYKESDHVHITALSAAVGVSVHVVYMDRGAGASPLNGHDFRPDACTEDEQPRLSLLYRPGHYDILYRATH